MFAHKLACILVLLVSLKLATAKLTNIFEIDESEGFRKLGKAMVAKSADDDPETNLKMLKKMHHLDLEKYSAYQALISLSRQDRKKISDLMRKVFHGIFFSNKEIDLHILRRLRLVFGHYLWPNLSNCVEELKKESPTFSLANYEPLDLLYSTWKIRNNECLSPPKSVGDGAGLARLKSGFQQDKKIVCNVDINKHLADIADIINTNSKEIEFMDHWNDGLKKFKTLFHNKIIGPCKNEQASNQNIVDKFNRYRLYANYFGYIDQFDSEFLSSFLKIVYYHEVCRKITGLTLNAMQDLYEAIIKSHKLN